MATRAGEGKWRGVPQPWAPEQDVVLARDTFVRVICDCVMVAVVGCGTNGFNLHSIAPGYIWCQSAVSKAYSVECHSLEVEQSCRCLCVGEDGLSIC